MKLTNRVAIITGAAQGMGRATSLVLAREGADILAADIDIERAEATAAEVREVTGRNAFAFKVDVAKPADVASMVHFCQQKLGDPDILVNCAGVLAKTAGLSIPDDEWDWVVDVNLKGTFLCIKAVVPLMQQKKRGWIVNVASVAAIGGSVWGDLPYAAAKAGVVGLTKTLARMLAPHGINVNAIAPSMVQTDMMIRAGRGTPESVAESAKKVPMGRAAKPEEIGQLIAFLASEESSYIAGELISLTGGGMNR